MTLTQVHRVAQLKTALGEKLVLRRMSFSERIGQPFALSITALAETETADMRSLLGTPLTVSLLQSGGSKTHFNGLVVEASQTVEESGGWVYTLQAEPAFHAQMAGAIGMEMFQDMSVREIMAELLGKHGIMHDFSGCSGGKTKRKYCVQYRESRFTFLSRLMEEEGIYYFHKHSDGQHTMMICDSNSAAFKPEPGLGRVRWYPPGAERQRAGDHINFFSPSHRRGVSSVRLRDYNFEMPKVFANTKEQDSARTKSNAVFNHYPGRYTTEGDGDKMAQLVLEAQNAGNQTAVAAGTACGLRVGGRFSLENPRDVGHDGTELAIVETSHDISLDSYRSSSGGGSEHVATVSLKAIPVSVPFRLPLSTPKPTILGPQTAVVTSGGGEIDVDEHGRILVRFHWDYAKRYDNGRASCRIRVAQSFAGGGWGAVFLPRAGQEVIVEFLNGDPDHPIVTGAVYNGEKKPPYDLPANKTRTVIKTDSSEGGGGYNELRLEDKKGREEVYLQAEKDMNTLVKNDETLTVGNNRTKTIQRGNETIKIEKGNRDTELGMGNDTLTLKMGNQETKISLGKSSTEALQSIELKVGANSIKVDQSGVTIKGLMVKIEGTAMLDVKAPVAMVKGDGMLKLNGGITMIN